MREPLPRPRIRRKTASVPRPKFDSRKADHARGRAHAVRATASRAASDAASRKRGMNASARSAGAHR
ncbi:glycine betaine/L-proline ABC transporter ATP-binding protein, partial [Burkholderia pseudomallei]